VGADRRAGPAHARPRGPPAAGRRGRRARRGARPRGLARLGAGDRAQRGTERRSDLPRVGAERLLLNQRLPGAHVAAPRPARRRGRRDVHGRLVPRELDRGQRGDRHDVGVRLSARHAEHVSRRRVRAPRPAATSRPAPRPGLRDAGRHRLGRRRDIHERAGAAGLRPLRRGGVRDDQLRQADLLPALPLPRPHRQPARPPGLLDLLPGRRRLHAGGQRSLLPGPDRAEPDRARADPALLSDALLRRPPLQLPLRVPVLWALHRPRLRGPEQVPGHVEPDRRHRPRPGARGAPDQRALRGLRQRARRQHRVRRRHPPPLGARPAHAPRRDGRPRRAAPRPVELSLRAERGLARPGPVPGAARLHPSPRADRPAGRGRHGAPRRHHADDPRAARPSRPARPRRHEPRPTDTGRRQRPAFSGSRRSPRISATRR